MKKIKYALVEGHPNLIRDLSTNAIINTDSKASEQYLKTRDRKKEEQKKIYNIESDIEELKSSIDEIKILLKSVLKGSVESK
jgi:hypothetical protein